MRNRKTLLAAAALMIVAALMAGLWYFTRPQTQVGDKTVVVEVVHGDESAKEFTYHTDAEYLGQVLVEEKLVKAGGVLPLLPGQNALPGCPAQYGPPEAGPAGASG